MTIGSFETSRRKGRYVKLTLTCTMSARATSGLLRSGFWLLKRLQKRLQVRKTERGERGHSFGYRIVENVRREEEIRAIEQKKGSKRIETADLLRSGFRQKKRLQKRLTVGKTERGERELFFDYRIVDNERQEEKMCDPACNAQPEYVRTDGTRVTRARAGYY